MRHADIERASAAPGRDASQERKTPRIFYRLAKARDGADQAEVFHHAVMQGAMAHYSQEAREAWASVLPRDGSAWVARQALYTTLVASCDGRCVGFLELDLRRQHVESLYVWPSLARRGIGSTLLVHAERLLVEQGADRVDIAASLVLADSLESRGWRRVREEWVERGGQRLRRRILEKSLVAVET
ncbi:GNAT family N-acetyltransferase [Halomonas caseinilytica]|uniref:Acetyltransferase, GNAT family n=1 Tax=Halomonas caseinilytica TaxID=438744 RepID=A0A1M6RK94_9GAMM|nr:GNAT family N-acetyltransferase [Halomonas caseinilytica]SEM08253.1 putative acetyltransferase [Halomonas caseinilytica]SHK32895.1 Acetyltransferase, GNAT family [Halomonas caseinilytica]